VLPLGVLGGTERAHDGLTRYLTSEFECPLSISPPKKPPSSVGYDDPPWSALVESNVSPTLTPTSTVPLHTASLPHARPATIICLLPTSDLGLELTVVVWCP
jgi:hypothetical protein